MANYGLMLTTLNYDWLWFMPTDEGLRAPWTLHSVVTWNKRFSTTILSAFTCFKKSSQHIYILRFFAGHGVFMGKFSHVLDPWCINLFNFEVDQCSRHQTFPSNQQSRGITDLNQSRLEQHIQLFSHGFANLVTLRILRETLGDSTPGSSLTQSLVKGG